MNASIPRVLTLSVGLGFMDACWEIINLVQNIYVPSQFYYILLKKSKFYNICKYISNRVQYETLL